MSTDSIAIIIMKKLEELAADSSIELSSLEEGVNLFAVVEPNAPPQCVTVFDAGDDDEPQKYANRAKRPFEYAAVQLMLRGPSYPDLTTWARQMIDALTQTPPWDYDDVRIAGVFLKSRLYLGRDERNLYRMSVNFRVPNQKTT